MCPRENEEALEAIREGLEQGAALRRAVAEGRISEDTAVAAKGRKTQGSQKTRNAEFSVLS